MFVHIVVFWLKDDLSKKDEARFRKAVGELLTLPSCIWGYAGIPSTFSDRPIIDKTYSFALTVLNRDVAGQAEYQVHPTHQKFLKEFARPMCKKVVVYDFEHFPTAKL